ncbi:hypothetical protein ACF0H5_016707 [Mactra antiquata]
MEKRGLLERLKDGGTIVLASGYVFELEQRGFVQFGQQYPGVVLSKPNEVEILHEEFALAGSDVIQGFTYYAHREALKNRGREDDLEKINTNAMAIAKRVADKYDKLLAGGLSNTPLYKQDDAESQKKIYEMFKEQVIWAVEAGADYILGETFDALGEAELALKAIKDHGKGVPAVITLAVYVPDITTDDIPIAEACRRLEEQGADVVGINCGRGPSGFIPLLKEIREVCKGPIAAIPVPFRTTEKEKSFYNLTDSVTGELVYPKNLDVVRCSRDEIRQFAEDAKAIGVQYIGLCCGNYPSLTREVAEVYGKNPPASKYSMKSKYTDGDDVSNLEPHILKIRKHKLGY